MMSVKMATQSHLKLTVIWNKGYDVIIHVDDATSKILSHDSSYIVDVFMWPKFSNCIISMRSYHNFNFIRIWPGKALFLIGVPDSNSVIWDWH